jgi:hypothetical protein
MVKNMRIVDSVEVVTQVALLLGCTALQLETREFNEMLEGMRKDGCKVGFVQTALSELVDAGVDIANLAKTGARSCLEALAKRYDPPQK